MTLIDFLDLYYIPKHQQIKTQLLIYWYKRTLKLLETQSSNMTSSTFSMQKFCRNSFVVNFTWMYIWYIHLIYNFSLWNAFQSWRTELTSSAVRLWPWGAGITTRRLARPAAGECCLACCRFLLESTGLGPGPGDDEPPSGDDELG